MDASVYATGYASVAGTMMLIYAVLASLAAGVLVAYAICQAMFRVFQMQSMQAAERREQVAAGTTAAMRIA